MGQNSRLFSADSQESILLDVLRHELGNALCGLSGVTGLLRTSGLSADQERWLDVIEQSGRQMRRLVEMSVCVRSIPDGVALGPAGRLNGIELLEQAVCSRFLTAQNKQMRLLLCVAADLPVAWRSDACLLRQLLDNLLGNAVKFGDGGDVIISARPAREGPESTLMLSVRDHGPGISRDQAKRVFEAYGRAVSDTGRQPPGQGLGLFICRHIVQALQGTIELRHPRGGGAEFCVRLPAVLRCDDTPQFSEAPGKGLRCRLELDGALQKSVALMLDRLSVPWEKVEPPNRRRRREEAASQNGVNGAAWPVIIREAQSGDGILLLRPGPDASEFRQRLPGPILESTLREALQALQCRALQLR
jgi:anti-sigma regulatory factor (Ser/Thr protein kinase)